MLPAYGDLPVKPLFITNSERLELECEVQTTTVAHVGCVLEDNSQYRSLQIYESKDSKDAPQ